MKPKLLLRIASGLIFIHGALHTVGFSGWKNAPDPVQQQVIAQMTGHQFPFMGAIHSLGDYYEGFGYGCSVALFLIAVMLWITSGELSPNNTLAKKIVIVLGIALLFWGIDEFIYFFLFAASLTVLACLLTVTSLYLLNKQKVATA